ncbi:MAG: helix-turn-helix transcriptional regulator, partial [Planctomycetes bacterium]|nr:helix-turn-helix transcriptional regulator [Planctomycetota bacterium]
IRHAPAPVIHHHALHELFWCESGRCMQLTATRQVENAAGELFFFPAGQDHNSNGMPGRVCQALVVNFDVALVGGDDDDDAALRIVLAHLRRRALDGDNRVPLSGAGARAVARGLADLVRECRERRPGWRAAIKLRMQEVLLAILRDERVLPALADEFRPSPAPERLDEVLRYIENRYGDPITVARMAALSGLGRSQFHVLFRRATGRTLIDHIAEVRVRAAERLLTATRLPIIEIGSATGFPSLSRFYHVFRARRGCTPAAVRRGRAASP